MKIQFSNATKAIGKLRPISLMLVVLALILCTAFTARAQNTSASLRGTVTDVQGAAVSGANVTITNADTGSQQTQKTGTEGIYVFRAFHSAVTLSGSPRKASKASRQRTFVLHVADSLTVDARLDVGAKSETIRSGRQHDASGAEQC